MAAKNIISAFAVYRLLKALSTPFNKSEMFKLGLIDDSGKRLRKAVTKEEREATTFYSLLINNLKQMISYHPKGMLINKSAAASLLLIKEGLQVCPDMTVADASRMILDLAEDIETSTRDLIMLAESEGGAMGSSNSIGTGTIDNTAAPKPLFFKKSTFGNSPVYHVDEDMFSKCTRAKGRYERFATYVNKDTHAEMLDDIRQFAAANPKRSILIHSEKMGAYLPLKLGKSNF